MTLTLIPLTGFLGAGKTTTMIAAAKLLEATGRTVAVITNDQGTELVDTDTARRAVGRVNEVTGGCFCCRFEDLAALLDQILATGDVDTVLIEAVGSCSDLQATVVRPMRTIYNQVVDVAPLTTIVEPLRYRAFAAAWAKGEDSDLGYLFSHQLAEADIIAVNKIDMVSGDVLNDTLRVLRDRYPKARLVSYSGLSGDGLPALVQQWQQAPTAEWDEPIDYDRYAEAEAGLAWLNQSYTVTAPGHGFDPSAWCLTALTSLSADCAEHTYLVGHIKARVTTDSGTVKASITSGAEPTLDERGSQPATQAIAVVNARVECEPEQMNAMLTAAVGRADAQTGAQSFAEHSPTSFKPGYPTPVHRVSARV